MAQAAFVGMQSELADAREQISRLQVERGTLEVKMQDLTTDLNTYKQRLDTTSTGVKKSVMSAAEVAVRELNEQKMKAEIERQFRAFMRSQQEQAD